MQRLPNYRANLLDLIAAKETEPFAYGKNDCSLFASDCVYAQTEIDLVAEHRGRYRTMAGGIRRLKEAGYTSHVDFLEKNFGEVPVAFAQFGDLGIVETDMGPAIVVMLGAIAAGINETGLVKFDVFFCKRAFAI